MPSGQPPISQRKADHIALAASGAADFRRTTLLECVQLTHQSLCELATEDIDLGTTLLGKRLQLPLVITGMTGGTDEARAINRDLAQVAEEMGVAFGVGSQRAMAEHPELISSYQVRDVAPGVLLLGNIGAVQAAAYGARRVAELAEQIGADALAVHLNPAQELIQPDGDRDFRGILDTIAALCDELSIPIIVKETGCGLSRESAQKLAALGIHAVDVSGAGGTSWVAVEAQRAPDSAHQALGQELWDWGIPTAVSTAWCAATGLEVIASGGLRTGLDMARALALGARAAGMAAPILRAHQARGVDGAREAIDSLRRSLTAILILCGCKTPGELQAAPRFITEPLRSYLEHV